MNDLDSRDPIGRATVDAAALVAKFPPRLGRARVEAVLRATRVIDPPTVTNLVAMEAPSGVSGRLVPSGES